MANLKDTIVLGNLTTTGEISAGAVRVPGALRVDSIEATSENGAVNLNTAKYLGNAPGTLPITPGVLCVDTDNRIYIGSMAPKAHLGNNSNVQNGSLLTYDSTIGIREVGQLDDRNSTNNKNVNVCAPNSANTTRFAYYNGSAITNVTDFCYLNLTGGAGTYNQQIAFKQGGVGKTGYERDCEIFIRGQANTTWGEWRAVLDERNYKNIIPVEVAGNQGKDYAGFLKTNGQGTWSVDKTEYLSQTDASNTYLSKTDAPNIYLSKTDALTGEYSDGILTITIP